MSNTPHHLAIIMDGNRRWARGRGLDVLRGHNQGAETLRDISRQAFKAGVDWVTVFAFSTENWSRPSVEVIGLINLMKRFLVSEIDSLSAENVKFRVIGDRSRFSEEIIDLISVAEDRTAGNTGLNLTIALNYGGRQELVAAAQGLAKEAASGLLDPSKINDDLLKSRMTSSALPQIDLLIRTGGESRISNFMLWDLSYAELYFTPVHWPEFTFADLNAALSSYSQRDRRFGGNAAPTNDRIRPVPSGSR